jgi:hypothetical protein
MHSLEYCLEHADELAQEVVNAWGVNVDAGNAKLLTDNFKALFEITCRYRTARETADNRRQFNLLNERDATVEKKTREAFARAYKDYEDKTPARLA